MSVERVFNKYYVSGKTDAGRCRDHNEDNILINSKAALIMVADGMGGHLYGDRASLEAINYISDLIQTHLPVNRRKKPKPSLWEKFIQLFSRRSNAGYNYAEQQQVISDILIEANSSIYRLNQNEQFEDGYGMGTTIVGCLFLDNHAKMLVFHVGDSRLYRLRNNVLSQITKDHSAYQLWLDGGQVGSKPGSNIILQGIGPASNINPETQVIDVRAGDAFLLCSDGLNDMLEHQAIENIVQNLNKSNIEEKVRQLIIAANENGGTDNVSVILICQ